MTSAQQSGGRTLCFGIDVGGTFTDCVLTEGERVWRAKSPTTPGAIGEGVIAAARLASERRGEPLEATLPKVARFGLGTTVVTNVLASRTGRRVGLITTKGFEKMIPLARGERVIDEEGWLTTPPALLEPGAIVGVKERIDRNGAIIAPLDLAEAEAAIRLLVEQRGIDALVVSFLWGFLNHKHEELVADLARNLYPDLTVFAAGSLHPAAREYERTTFALLNAYVSGSLGGLDVLAEELAALGLEVPLLLVHSGGGSIGMAEARRRPLGLAASGPTAGVAACVAMARATGLSDVVTCDLGGTSFDVSVVMDGEPARRTRGNVMGMWTALSMVDVESIGSGGGSIGWIDARGLLRVGPRSAGSRPGPACYGRGGTEATLTDALVVLGYIDPERFLGGTFRLDPAAAETACARLGERLGMDAGTVAWGIRRLALADMVRATRGRTGALGLDLREMPMISFGGSGSLFTPDIAMTVGAPKVLVPELASVLSALGAATTDIRRERIASVLASFPLDAAVVEATMAELREAALVDLASDGVAKTDRSAIFEADLRFARQISEIARPLAPGGFDAAAQEQLIDGFRSEYARRYGHGALVLGAPIELVAIRAIGIGRTVQARLAASSEASAAAAIAAPVARYRKVRLDRGDAGCRDIAVYDREDLLAGHMLRGPALVDAPDTTIWVPAGLRATIDGQGTLVMEREADPRSPWLVQERELAG
jgi:N-methylhydantoinase A